jgi:hypothetical protein
MSFLTNASYFFAISVYKGALGTAIGNYVIVNLDNGARFSGTFTPTKGATAQDTDVYIGNRGLNSRQGLCDVAAAMQSNTFLTLPQLLRWADDPWSFWYQNKIDHLVGVSTPSTNKPFFINFPMGGM